MLRATVLSQVAYLFLFWRAFSFIAEWDGGDERWVPLAVVGVGSVELASLLWIRRKQLRGATPTAIANSYSAVFFISIGMAMTPALASVWGVLIVGSLWIYLIGFAFSLVGLAWIAPTRRDIKRRQAEITASGSPLSLLDALLAQPPGRTPDMDGTK